MNSLFVTSEDTDLEKILHAIGDAICIADKDMNLLGANKRFADLYGVPAKQLVGVNVFDIYPEFKSSVFYEAFQHTIATGESATRVGYSSNLKKWIVSRSAKYDDDKYIATSHVLDTGFNQVGYITNFDSLTSLKNRFSLEKDLNTLMSCATPVGLIILDIKRFRFLNESFGLEFGDMCLMEAAARIKGTSNNNNQAYRINADQFAIVSTQSKDNCVNDIKKLLHAFKNPFNINSEDYVLDLSIGFCYSNSIRGNAADLLHHTESALKNCKNLKLSYSEFNANLPIAKGKMLLAKQLKQAISNGQLQLYYQAQVDTIHAKICGAEALIRWVHPEKGVISPADFLPIAEDHDLMKEIDKFVIVKSFQHLSDMVKEGVPIPLSINLSSQTICDPTFINNIDVLLKRIFIDPSMITIEITEGAIMSNIEVSKQVINHLKKCGFKIAIDDFGTGYSSISYIVRYPTDYLKIDKTFITNIHNDKNLQTIFKNITKMCHSLGITIVAEGVECAEEANELRKHGCDIIQGFLYARPETKSSLIEKIKKIGISKKSAFD